MVTVRNFQSRQVLYNVGGGEIRNFYGQLQARYDSQYLRDVPGLIQFKFTGNEIRDYAGLLVWKKDGKYMRRVNGMCEYIFDDQGIAAFSGYRLYIIEGNPSELEKLTIFAYMLGRS